MVSVKYAIARVLYEEAEHIRYLPRSKASSKRIYTTFEKCTNKDSIAFAVTSDMIDRYIITLESIVEEH